MAFQATENLAEQIASYLTTKIVQFELKPGERIIEAKLSEEMGVSRSPVREALRILEKDRLVELIPRRGARVTDLTESYILNLNDILKEIMGLVAYRGVEKGDKKDLQLINSALKEMEQSAKVDDIDAYQEGTLSFALYSCGGAKNPLLEEVVNFLWPDVRRIQFAALSLQKGKLLKNLKFYQSARDHFSHGDAAGATKVIRELVEHETQFAIKRIREFQA